MNKDAFEFLGNSIESGGLDDRCELDGEANLYARIVRPVVESMLAITVNDDLGSCTTFVKPEDRQASFPFGCAASTTVIVRKPIMSGTYPKPEGSGVWGWSAVDSGSLNLRAVALFNDHVGYTNETYKIGLAFLPVKRLYDVAASFLTVSFSSEGEIEVDQYTVDFMSNAGFWGKCAQIYSGEDIRSSGFQPEDLNSIFFPGAQEYLLKHLPLLPRFLAGEAENYKKSRDGRQG